MSEIKVNSIKGVGASTAAITVNNTDGTCTANLTNRTNKNLVINGAMQVAQRGTSSTISGINTVDRWSHDFTGTDESPTFEQAAVTTGGAYDSGFRTCLKATNGNQTSGAGAGDFIFFRQRIEAQDVATSGWNYVSASSNITVSFWAKSSVAQTFQVELNSVDGTRRIFCFEFTISSTDTWTKITKTISGNSGLQFDNNSNNGLEFVIFLFIGTNNTASGGSLDAWGNYSDRANIRKDMTSTWYTTNDATFELTGVQLEVSDHATSFEFLSFADELRRCQRYFEKSFAQGDAPAQNVSGQVGYYSLISTGSKLRSTNIPFKVVKRTFPTMTYFNPYAANALARLPFSSTDLAGIATDTAGDNWFVFSSTDTSPSPTFCHLQWTASAEL